MLRETKDEIQNIQSAAKGVNQNERSHSKEGQTSLKEFAQGAPCSLTGCPPSYPLAHLAFLDSVDIPHDSSYLV